MYALLITGPPGSGKSATLEDSGRSGSSLRTHQRTSPAATTYVPSAGRLRIVRAKMAVAAAFSRIDSLIGIRRRSTDNAKGWSRAALRIPEDIAVLEQAADAALEVGLVSSP